MTELDQLINAKLTQKGNQIIYELDLSNRELRMLKDNFYLMERLMRQELHHEYQASIEQRDLEIKRLNEGFTEYRKDLNQDLKFGVAHEI